MSATLDILQFVLLFGLSVIFSAFAVNRNTPLTHFLAAVMWIATGLINFMFNPSGAATVALSYLALGLGATFFIAGFKVLGDMLMERKDRRWSVTL